MIFTRNLIDLWDPEMKYRDGDQPLSIFQIITIPLLIVGTTITFVLDVITLPYQLRQIYRDI